MGNSKLYDIMTKKNALYAKPDFSEEDLQRCRDTADFKKVLFEYYRFVAQLSSVCAGLVHESDAWCGRSRKCWEVLAANLTRMSKLMAANLEFFQDDRYGEATQIIDR